MDGCSGFTADSQEGSKCVVSASQVRELSDILQRVPLLRFQRECLKTRKEKKKNKRMRTWSQCSFISIHGTPSLPTKTQSLLQTRELEAFAYLF